MSAGFKTGKIRLNFGPSLDDDGIKEALFKVASSRLGTSKDALRLIEYAAGELITGRPLDSDVQDWLGFALMAIAQGANPKTALGLQKRGAPPKLSWEDVLPLVHYRIVAGEAWTTVCNEAAHELGKNRGEEIDEKTVRLIYTSTLKDWYDQWIVDPLFDGHPTEAQTHEFFEFTFAAISACETQRSSIKRGEKR